MKQHYLYAAYTCAAFLVLYALEPIHLFSLCYSVLRSLVRRAFAKYAHVVLGLRRHALVDNDVLPI